MEYRRRRKLHHGTCAEQSRRLQRGAIAGKHFRMAVTAAAFLGTSLLLTSQIIPVAAGKSSIRRSDDSKRWQLRSLSRSLEDAPSSPSAPAAPSAPHAAWEEVWEEPTFAPTEDLEEFSGSGGDGEVEVYQETSPTVDPTPSPVATPDPTQMLTMWSDFPSDMPSQVPSSAPIQPTDSPVTPTDTPTTLQLPTDSPVAWNDDDWLPFPGDPSPLSPAPDGGREALWESDFPSFTPTEIPTLAPTLEPRQQPVPDPTPVPTPNTTE